MVTDSPLYYTDRSACETDDRCGMEYFWNRKYNGMGIVPKNRPIYFKIGSETHEDLAAIAEMEDISPESINTLVKEITDPLNEEDKQNRSIMEVLYRRLGWLSAYALYIEPRIRAEFENVQVESEIILDRTPLWIAITPDRVLRHRQGKYLVYREYKTTITAGQKWVRHWPYDIQVHCGIQAIQEELNEKVAYAQIMGLMKGDTRGERLAHPYVWGYYNEAQEKWTHDYAKARAAGWAPAPVWDYPGGVVEWVQRCGEEVAIGQFPHSAPCFLNERMLDNWVNRRISREIQVAEEIDTCQTDLDQRQIYFEQRTRNCSPAFGDPCAYIPACWNAGINDNPLASGIFEKREPHHEVEIQFYRNANEVPNGKS
jgi:hypothetical protein